ncbi:MAG: hypothetical protein ACFFD2_05825 [Promethearchaeota archaeon]
MEQKDIIQKLEMIYQNLMTKDLTPDEEAQAKVELLEILSSIKAYAEIQEKEQAKNVIEETNSLKDLLLEWDPYGSAWFKEEKTLVNSVFNLLAAVKTLIIQNGADSKNMVINDLKQKIDDIATSLNSEIHNLKNEIATIKKSVITIATAIKEKYKNQPKSNQAEKSASNPSIQKSIPLNISSISIGPSSQPKPVPLPRNDPEKTISKPISLPKSTPIPINKKSSESHPQPFRRNRQKPIEIPKSKPVKEPGIGIQPTFENEPAPIPLSESENKEPIPLDGPKGESEIEPSLFPALSSTNKKSIKKPNKEQLFNLFSGPTTVSNFGELELVEEPSELIDQAISQPAQFSSQGSTSNMDSDLNAETLYQELITLEGKRYSIERSIRDLKTDRENELISDQEYKEKISQFLNKLQTISKRIGEIRGILD